MSRAALYDVFTRTWWKEATGPGWPNNLEPEAGEKTHIARGITWAAARHLCEWFKENNDPGRYSLKAEFEEA
jgi:hypothetical protein